MVFFTTPELLEIGDIPMTSLNEKPVRAEALKYYRRVADHYKLDIRQYQRVERITGDDGAFVTHSTDMHGCARQFQSKKVILSTGYYDLPNRLNVPGEDYPTSSITTRNRILITITTWWWWARKIRRRSRRWSCVGPARGSPWYTAAQGFTRTSNIGSSPI